MRGKLESTEEMWISYRDGVGVPRGGVQEVETRRAFFGGQHALLQKMKAVADAPDATGITYLNTLQTEHASFAAAVAEGKA